MKLRFAPRFLRIIFATLSFLLTLSAFFYFTGFAGAWVNIQTGPNLIKLFTSFTAAALAIVLVTLFLTFLFGRFYCSVFCPLGILQDFINWLNPKKRAVKFYNWLKARYIIAAAAFAALAGGWAIVFKWLDPYSNFGAIAAYLLNPLMVYLHNLLRAWRPMPQPINSVLFIIIGGALPLLILTGLVIWKKRFYCTTLCPVGTLLGLCSKKGLFGLAINRGTCVSCGKCVKACPAGCIDIPRKNINNELCVRCMNCVAACPLKSIGFHNMFALKPAHTPAVTDLSKRNFIVGGAVTAAALGASAFAKPGSAARPVLSNPENLVCPPGAGSMERFASKCTSCLLCVTNCKGKVLTPANVKHKTIHLDFAKGFCEFNCNNCTNICPTGALNKMGLKQKRLCRIGMAELTMHLCIAVTDGTGCGSCSEQCPTGAMQMTDIGGPAPVPELIEELCIGCGACANACPVNPVKAIAINPVSVQVQAQEPKEYFRKIRKAKGLDDSPESDDWLF